MRLRRRRTNHGPASSANSTPPPRHRYGDCGSGVPVTSAGGASGLAYRAAAGSLAFMILPSPARSIGSRAPGKGVLGDLPGPTADLSSQSWMRRRTLSSKGSLRK